MNIEWVSVAYSNSFYLLMEGSRTVRLSAS